jgi:glutamate-1-semialdehyde 2,1-aminomutase
MAAGLAGLEHVLTPAEVERFNALGDQLRERLNGLAAAVGVPLQATGLGSLIGLHFADRPITTGADGDPPDTATGGSARRALGELLHLEMLERGYYFGRRGYIALSLPTTDADVERFAMAFDDFLARHGSLIAEVVGC